MNFLHEFLHQEVPKSSREMPGYYRRALFLTELIYCVYFLASIVLILLTTGKLEWLPVGILVAMVLCLLNMDHMTARLNLLGLTVIIGVWLTWYVVMYGWSGGSPNILVPVLSLAFFNIYVPPWEKIGYCLGTIAFRIGLYAFSLRHPPVSALFPTSTLFFQIVNSVVPLLQLSINYILFSSSIQASERQLTINNQALHKEAGTDPLTGLPNRRAMLDAIEVFRSENPASQFSLAIADIDFFKKVNDTYGHHCGDYTLVELSRLFLSSAGDKYRVCRWGGEEFCFFMPELNLDDAGIVMQDLHQAVGRMPLCFGENHFRITITIGVEEYDFQSPTDALLDRADRKLYMGKVHGRNQVVL